MSLYSSYATDPALEKNGVRVTYPDFDRKDPQAIRITLARLTGRSSRYKQVQERLMKPFRGEAYDVLSDDAKAALNRRLFVEAAILRWETRVYEGAKVEEGVVIKEEAGANGAAPTRWAQGIELRCGDGVDRIVTASVDNMCAALEMAPDFAEMLAVEARGSDLFKVERLEEDSKNS